MAYYRKQRDKWRAEIQRNGVRQSATFPTKAEAMSWATRVVSEAITMKHGGYPKILFRQAIERYINEVSAKKRGYRFEKLRLEALCRDYPHLVEKPLLKLTASDFGAWRDEKLKTLSPGSVQRELNLISNLFSIAQKEWGWLDKSPLQGIRQPGDNPSRDRRVTPSEVKAICRRLGYVTGRIETKKQEVALAFLISLHTAMRAGEVLSLNHSRMNLKARVLTVPHKTQHITGKERQIPITKKAARLIGYLVDRGRFFTINEGTREAYFRRACHVEGINDLHFHDARAEALTRLSRKVDVMTLAKISGHADLKILLRTYYRETPEEIAQRL
jgi:integrase